MRAQATLLLLAVLSMSPVRGQTRPPNDDFADATLLSGAAVDFAGSVRGTTIEAGEPPFEPTANVGTVWWRWTAPALGYLRVTHRAPVPYPDGFQVSLARGSDLANLQLTTGLFNGTTLLRVFPGETHFMTLRGPADSEVVMSFTIAFEPNATPPANDLFANRARIESVPAQFDVDFYGSLGEPGDRLIVAPAEVRGSLWWEWTAPADAYADFSAPSLVIHPFYSNFVRVFSPDGPPALDNLGQNIERISRFSPEVTSTFRAYAGRTYIIAAVAPAYVSVPHRLAFSTRPLPAPPANDNFANRTQLQLQNSSFNIRGNYFGATFEASDPEPELYSYQDGGSVWWTWTAQANGFLNLLPVQRPDFESPAQLEIFASNAETAPTAATRIRTTRMEAFERLQVRAGQTYVFGLFGRTLVSKEILVEVTFEPQPANDNFDNRSVISPSGGQFSGSTLNATLEAGEPNWSDWWNFSQTDGYGSVWWTWTPAFTGFAAIEVLEAPRGFGFGSSALDIRQGSTLAELSAENSRVALLLGTMPFYRAFPVTGGQTYSLAMVGSADAFYARTLWFRMTVSPNPVILRHPRSQDVRSGDSAFFEVLAPGIPFENIRWQRNREDFFPGGAQPIGPALQLNNIRAVDVAEYRAVITHLGRESYSLNAVLNVDTPDAGPTLHLTQVPGESAFNVRVSGEPNLQYAIEWAAEGSGWQWIDFPAPIFYSVNSEQTLALPSQIAAQNSHLMLRAQRRGDLRQWCIANLRRIALAKEHLGVRNYLGADSFVDPTEADRYFVDGPPRCPRGGFYIYGSLSHVPTCSVDGHFIPLDP